MLEEQINKDYIQAMKDRDSAKSSTLNFLRAAIKNVRIEKRIEKVEDIDVVAVIKKQVKQRQDSIAQYTSGNRPELAQKEQAELDMLKQYLPQELSEEAVSQIIRDVIKETQATSIKDMGKIMKPIMDKTAGQADNKMVSDLVKKILSQI